MVEEAPTLATDPVASPAESGGVLDSQDVPEYSKRGADQHLETI